MYLNINKRVSSGLENLIDFPLIWKDKKMN